MNQTEIGTFIAKHRKEKKLTQAQLAEKLNITDKDENLIASGISFLLAIPFLFIINIMLSKMTAEPVLDIWDMLSVFILFILAFASFICGYAKKKGLMKEKG